MYIILFVSALIPFYLLGSIPSGYLIAKKQGIDIREYGSGNIGATNVARTLGKKAGVLTLSCDVLKGLLAVAVAYIISDDVNFIAWSAPAVIAGHCFSIPGKLPRGKGVATTAGAFLLLAPSAALISLGIFCVIFYFKRIVSLAALSAILTLPICTMLMNYQNNVVSVAILSALIVCFRHKDNIARYIKGKEEKFKF